jgi:hypothetical protein
LKIFKTLLQVPSRAPLFRYVAFLAFLMIALSPNATHGQNVDVWPLWPAGAPGLHTQVPPDKIYITHDGDHVVSGINEPFAMPQASTFQPGGNKSLDGRIIGLNERFLTVDGKPWLPVMGEFHYSRVSESELGRRDSQDESQRREYHCGLYHLTTS